MSEANKNQGFLNPSTIVNSLDIQRGMSVADFGCGAGHFTLSIARLVGPEGSVTGIDVHDSVLEALEGHKKIDNLAQLKTVRGDLESDSGSGLQGDSQDLVLCANILHQVEHSENILKEARRVLKPGGRVVVIDWVERSPLGPKQRISRAEVEKIAGDTGLQSGGELDAGMAHYGLIFTK
ncbi:MAG: methyltransferase domain-containing protein [Candidatus Spechtbacterales bacterium]